MCGDQGVWLFPPSCSLIPGRVLEDAFFSTREQENKQGKPKGTDRVSPQQPADLQGSGYHPQRQAREFPGHPIPSQAHLPVLPAGGSVVLCSEQRPQSCQEREVNYRYLVEPREDPRKSLTLGLPHGCHSVSLESSLCAARDCRRVERKSSFNS